MTVFIDSIIEYPEDVIAPAAKRFGRNWCHMWTDGDIEELHIMAERVGLNRSHCQYSQTLIHYDLIPGKRVLAVMAGAVDGDLATLVEFFRKRLKKKKKRVKRSKKIRVRRPS